MNPIDFLHCQSSFFPFFSSYWAISNIAGVFLLSFTPMGGAVVIKGISWHWGIHDYSSGASVLDMGVPTIYMAVPVPRIQVQADQLQYQCPNTYGAKIWCMNTGAPGWGSEEDGGVDPSLGGGRSKEMALFPGVQGEM